MISRATAASAVEAMGLFANKTVRERPILFGAPMVLAILAGKKTQTRRIVKAEHLAEAEDWVFDPTRGEWESGEWSSGQGVGAHVEYVRCPYGIVGDRLWVKETWFHRGRWIRDMDEKWKWDGWEPKNENARIDDIRILTADGDPKSGLIEPHPTPENWGKHVWRKRPSIYMPRWASRITLEVTDARVERLQDISEDDARAEGVLNYGEQLVVEHDDPSLRWARARFQELWDTINGKRAPWASNPWVWVVSFKRVESTLGTP